ncbi:Fe-S protein assembly chaperone HscA [Anaeromyxobacter sp. K]|uniref:Fe-S protein assembly chaperone HscA n=1 Tax=Anaeromyxobacter sp. (strain K) TaxID=447217 RepID=UPI00015F9F8D|nr:Fe-S protein assembly chaperone HscA [Anaeromyxobacter sp. K]ACG71870.1 Fe-S protein assembly chaperone HscA [Anaeromyxobacter sp. K]
MPRAIGIDLGTTNSLVAHVDERNRPRILPVDEGRPLLASAVFYPPDGSVEVGGAAKRRAPERPVDTILSVKRFMGRGPGDIRPEDRGIYQFDEAGAMVRLRVGGGKRTVTPIEVSAEILRVLRRAAGEALGGAPGGCVITVPAYFDDAQRQATKDAGRLAGLDVLRLLNEPTAAAVAYGLDKRSQGVFAVYDLGGGTFDVSILRLEEGVFEVLSTVGDTHLGGDDFDRLVARTLLDGGLTPPNPDPSPAVLRGAVAAAQRIREALTDQETVEAEVELPEGHHLRARLTRAELEALILPVVERTTIPCRAALRDAGVEKVDGVVLVGGATRTPLVRRHVKALFGQEPLTDLDPDTVVALGAAVQADALDRGGREDVLLLDVIPLSLGVEMMGGVVEKIILRNSTIPASATQQFTTYADGQTGMVIHVVQGERELARDCRSLARFTLKGIPPMPAGIARVEITYSVDADGILQVSARELTTGIEQRIQVKPTYGLTEEEVEHMLVESIEHAEEDVSERFLREWRVEGDRILSSLETAFAMDGELLRPDERAAVEERMRGLRTAMEGTDYLAVKAWIESVDAASKAFAERRMDKHVAKAMAGHRVDEFGDAPPATGAKGEDQEHGEEG